MATKAMLMVTTRTPITKTVVSTRTMATTRATMTARATSTRMPMLITMATTAVARPTMMAITMNRKL